MMALITALALTGVTLTPDARYGAGWLFRFFLVFAPQVRIEIPGGASDSHAASTASYILGQVAKIASGIKYVLTADAGNNWYFLGFEFQIEDQGVDQVHLNEDGKIDRLINYMRPIPVAQKFSELVSRRLQPTG